MHTPCTRLKIAVADTQIRRRAQFFCADHDRTSKDLPSALCARAAGASLECRLRLSIELSVRLADAVELEAPLPDGSVSTSFLTAFALLCRFRCLFACLCARVRFVYLCVFRMHLDVPTKRGISVFALTKQYWFKKYQ